MSNLQLIFDQEVLRREGVKYEPLSLEDHTKEILLNGAKFQEGDKLDPNLAQLFDQLRPLSFEASVHIVRNRDGKLLYQQTPDIGDREGVTRFIARFVEEDYGFKRLLSVHNHPGDLIDEGNPVKPEFFLLMIGTLF